MRRLIKKNQDKRREELNKNKTNSNPGGGGAQFNKRKNYGNNQTGGDKTTTNKTSSKFIKYKGKMYRRGTPGAKKAEAAEAARKRLGSKNYMTKEKIAERKKRLKIKK